MGCKMRKYMYVVFSNTSELSLDEVGEGPVSKGIRRHDRWPNDYHKASNNRAPLPLVR